MQIADIAYNIKIHLWNLLQLRSDQLFSFCPVLTTFFRDRYYIVIQFLINPICNPAISYLSIHKSSIEKLTEYGEHKIR